MADHDQPAPETDGAIGDLVLHANGEVMLRTADGTEVVLRTTSEVLERAADGSESVLRPSGEVAVRHSNGSEGTLRRNGEVALRYADSSESVLLPTGEVVLRDIEGFEDAQEAGDRLRRQGEYLQELAGYVIEEAKRRVEAAEDRAARD